MNKKIIFVITRFETYYNTTQMRFILLFVISFVSFITYCQGPTAQFNATPLIICAGQSVTFTDASTAGSTPITDWDWDFGDGNAANTQNTSHVYTLAGTYTVILVVTDQNNIADPEVKTAYITVNSNPTASFTASANSCTLPVTATFNNASATGSNITYAWNFGNGQTSTLQNPSSITYNSVNTYTVSLLVTNTTTSCSSTFSNTITISDFAADFTMVDSVCVGGAVTVNDNSTVGVNNWNWNSGSGQTSTIENPTFIYNTVGTFTVSLTSQNTLIGCTSSTTQQIVVVPRPIPTFVADQTHGCLPFNVTFTNSTSNGANYQWTFGDGTTYSGQTPPIHLYNTVDTFTVTLSCTGTLGCSASTTFNNYIYTSILYADFDAFNYNGCSPITTNYFDGSGHWYSTYDPVVSWLWTFEDGSTYNGQVPPADIYTTGLYDVSLTVTTGNGCIDTESKLDYIQVGEIDSIDFTYSPSSNCARIPFTFDGIPYISVPYLPNEIVYNWQFGDGDFASTQDASHGYSIDTGYFDVSFTVNFRGCIDTMSIDSAIYLIGPISKFEPSPLHICNPTSFPVSATMVDMSVIGQPSDDVKMIWKWNDPVNGTTVYEDVDLDPDDDGGATYPNFPDYGIYPIEQVIYNYTTGCADSTVFNMHILQTTADFILSSDTICIHDEVQFTSTSTSTEAINYYNYLFDNNITVVNDNVISSIIPDTTILYDSSAIYLVQHHVQTYVTYNVFHCTSTITKPLVVLQKPLALITPSDDASCAPVTINFTNSTTPQGVGYPTFGTFTWTFPDNSTQVTNNLATPTSYNFTTQGNFTTSLVATDDFGCVSDPVSITTSITLPVLDYTLDSVVCDEEIFTVPNTTTGSGPISYSWTVDNIPASNSTDLTHSFNEATDTTITNMPHTITLYATDVNGCIDSLTKDIIVSMPFANLDYTATAANLNNNNYATCPPVFETYDNQSTSYGTYTSNWIFGDGKVSYLTEPSNTYVFAGVYTLSMEITDQFGCTDDTVFVDYLTIGGPTIDYLITPTPNPCDNQYFFDTLATENVVGFVWDFGDGTTASDTTIAHNFPEAGTYNTSVTIEDSLGCSVIYPLDSITVNNQINAYFVPNTYTAETGDVVTFDDQSTFHAPGLTWYWEFGDFDENTLLNSTDASTSFSYAYPYYYPVTLTVTDTNGCVDSYQTLIHITGAVNAPNVFTPNGDGVNDTFSFKFDIFKSYDVTIINRWGNVVYDRKNETETYIWDGSNMGGNQCSEGVYYYLIIGTLMDDSPFETKGFVTKI